MARHAIIQRLRFDFSIDVTLLPVTPRYVK